MPLDTWIVVADAARARMLSTNPELTIFEESADLVHPKSRMKDSELITETAHRGGRGARSGPPLGTPPHDLEARTFAVELGAWLRKAFADGAYKDLVIVAPPGFLGLLRDALHPEVWARLQHTVGKDYSRLPMPELKDRLRRVLGERSLVG